MPNDIFIAADPNSAFQPMLYKYGNNLYELIPCIAPSGLTPAPPIQMWKSTDGGATWVATANSLLSRQPETAAVCLIGTKLYIVYQTDNRFSFEGLLGYFDFTTELFSIVTTTGPIPQPTGTILAASSAALIYLLFGGTTMKIGKLVSNAYSSLGSLTAIVGANVMYPSSVLLGASGILHILYNSSPLGVDTDPSNLDYCNVQSGSLVGSTGSTVVLSPFSDGWTATNQGVCSQPVQLGSAIMLSYYDPFTQQIKLLSFNDVASPTFTTSVIEPTWPITAPLFTPTGAWVTALGLVGTTLYCFYTNFSILTNGDGWLYLRTSTDGGATWSARKQVVQHISPQSLTPSSILIPHICQSVAGASLSPILPVTYRTNEIG